MSVTITAELPAPDELVALYGAVGWTAYTADPDRLAASVAGSTLVLAARDEAGALVGLARTLSDGHTIVYLQDILVDPAHQRDGIGGALLDEVLARADGIRQIVLQTDTDPGQRAFYESRGFIESHDNGLRSFALLR
ncbi:GNAT family N-acetyltransferase [Microbacterium gorillae]|uniref:GNAT family N-acetyltransferase n=1 Tax=Microbacterium gorillae TaxID=1231063 RepID=UPI00058E8088|nr:GNAT family N-acetyltransferase [Microbacterium gorillae]